MLSDPEARRSKHSDYYDGYLLEVLFDADAELITDVDALPANGNEAVKAEALLAQEETAQGNDIASLSIDTIGCNGAMRLRQGNCMTRIVWSHGLFDGNLGRQASHLLFGKDHANTLP